MRRDQRQSKKGRISNGICSARGAFSFGRRGPGLEDVIANSARFLSKTELAQVANAFHVPNVSVFRLLATTHITALCPVLRGRLDGYGVEDRGRSVSFSEGPPPMLAIHYAWPFLSRFDRFQVLKASPVFTAYAGLRWRCCSHRLGYLARPRAPIKDTPILQRSRMWDMAAAALAFDFYHPDYIRFLGNEYSGQRRNWNQVAAILDRVKDTRLPDNSPPILYQEFWEIITQGAPLHGHFQCRQSATAQRNLYNNHPSVMENFDDIVKKFGEEETKSFNILLPRFLWRFYNGCHLSFINWVPPRVCPPREGRIIIDPSSHMRDPIKERPSKTAPTPPSELPIGFSIDYKYRRRHQRGELLDNGAPNDRIPPAGTRGRERENPPVHYGSAMQRTLTHIWALRAKYPCEDILMLLDDVSAAFRWVTYHPISALAFCTVLDDMFVIPVTQTFGTRSSPSFYMIPAELRAHLATAMSFKEASADLCEELWQPPLPSVAEQRRFVQAKNDRAQPRQRLENRPNERLSAPFVDDTNNVHVRPNIAACVNASVLAAYVIFAFPGESRLNPPINVKKWNKVALWMVIFLGFLIDTRNMRMTWPQNKRDRLAMILQVEWGLTTDPFQECRITPALAQQTLGLIQNGAQVAPFGSLMSIRLQFVLNKAMARHRHRCQSSHFRRSHKFLIPPDALQDMLLLQKSLLATEPLGNVWSRPIGLLIDRTPTNVWLGDAAYEGLGGFCLKLRVMWRLNESDLQYCGFAMATVTSLRKGFKPLAGDDDGQIHINILEFITIIINVWFAATLQRPNDLPSHRIWEFLADNTTAVSWVSHAARVQRPAVTRLTRFLTVLLFHLSQTTRVQATYLPGDQNQDADLLSRTSSRALSWASVIEQGSPALRACVPYQVPLDLLQALSTIVSQPVTADWYERETMRLLTLEPRILQITSWDCSSTTSLLRG